MAFMNKQTEPWNTAQRYELRNRYVFTGTLVMETALHIGGGKDTLSSSDSPVVLTPDQQPYIPGSSFKGALRSTVEKIAANLSMFSTCGLLDLSETELKEASPRGQPIGELCPTIRQKNITDERQKAPDPVDFAHKTLNALCDTCRLFGSPYAASRVNISDLSIVEDEWSGILQIRDGVAIDRDTEKARDRLKYDFEVVPPDTRFHVRIVLENASRKDLQLLCIGLSEYARGFGVVGGKRSRGLGTARLERLQVQSLELSGEGADGQKINERRMGQYLVSKTFPGAPEDGAAFLEKYINSIFM